MRSAEGFQKVMLPPGSEMMMASPIALASCWKSIALCVTLPQI
jgi:hypothetical protein